MQLDKETFSNLSRVNELLKELKQNNYVILDDETIKSKPLKTSALRQKLEGESYYFTYSCKVYDKNLKQYVYIEGLKDNVKYLCIQCEFEFHPYEQSVYSGKIYCPHCDNCDRKLFEQQEGINHEILNLLLGIIACLSSAVDFKYHPKTVMEKYCKELCYDLKLLITVFMALEQYDPDLLKSISCYPVFTQGGWFEIIDNPHNAGIRSHNDRLSDKLNQFTNDSFGFQWWQVLAVAIVLLGIFVDFLRFFRAD